ncbi:MAG TPA: rod shape-determining protein MreC [Phycisphaerales bacterium]|nr:rod shape-determining protein MreC [Phycisphaerales bacterium]HMP37762.1 rod shape-determining protein MreC [Phycisphaerales bacterium]
MARSAPQSSRWLIATVAVLLVLSLAPARWLGWTSDVAAILAMATAPAGHLGNALRARLRPPPDALSEDPRALEAALLNRNQYRSLWMAERLRSEELVQQLEDIRLAERFGAGTLFDPLLADIVGRRPDALRGPVRLNVGRAAGVRRGDVAVFRGAHLLGRIVEEPDLRGSLLLPITDGAHGRLHAAVLPDPEDADPAPRSIALLLAAQPDGTFVADVDHDARVRTGDPVVLNDPAWPETARGMIVGEIESIDRRDDQPLRRRVRVRPRYGLHELATVVLKIAPRGGGFEAADDPAPGDRR